MSVQSGTNTNQDSEIPAEETGEIYSLKPCYNPEDTTNNKALAALKSVLDDTMKPNDEHINPRHNRNIAISGVYGSGKSSIILGLSEDPKYENRIRVLSMSTIATYSEPSGKKAKNKHNRHINELLQKTIVTQLIYSNDSHEAPKSRFGKLHKPISSRLWIASFFTGLSIFLLFTLFLSKQIQKLITNIANSSTQWNVLIYLIPKLTNPKIDQQIRSFIFAYTYSCLSFIFYVFVFAMLWWLSYEIIKNSTVKIGFSNISASLGKGENNIKLENRQQYFNMNLDEIIYFFETNPLLDIIVFEDLDRFKNTEIFDSLRELNTILNNAPTLKNANRQDIRFIYAVRDSLFTDIEGKQQTTDSTFAQPGTARTKFFDVIIPVRPFVSTLSAYEQLAYLLHLNINDISSENNQEVTEEDKQLLQVAKIAGKYLSDMRQLKAIVTEYNLYKKPASFENSTAKSEKCENAKILAMCIYHAVAADDFEKIAANNSNLDKLYQFRNKIVESFNLQKEASSR
ncbi:hypothetical protein OZX62_08420 [Bifidobacterium sp. ESL0690]|uniref:YobI family P-loop NTPase n=1 Tax=Bifidobacterium sp. ESL0690 TaxID=2983214 RepID=UPI0023F97396|nr:hypothetical protein [Bifidobacterium sp. ESL0690]WEV46447.1 hypothetical protein OZX62_08420 [Bifidobacterium sp. ESL0690]